MQHGDTDPGLDDTCDRALRAATRNVTGSSDPVAILAVRLI
jgi:hypothetical protein